MSFSRIEYKSRAQLAAMCKAGQVVADIHDALRQSVQPGVTTAQMDAVAAEVIARAGAKSNFLGYHGFTGNICVSVNEEIVHGIPGSKVLEAGDIVSFDCGAVVDGWHGDACFTTVVGGLEYGRSEDLELLRIAEKSMWAGIAAFATGKFVGDIGQAIEDVVVGENPDFEPGIVEEYIGHGIGSAMHQPPDVPNYATRGKGARLRPGMALCIEPMLTVGEADNHTLEDGWTVVTNDGSRAVHVEHEVVRHEDGIWVITARDGGLAGLAPFGVVPVAP